MRHYMLAWLAFLASAAPSQTPIATVNAANTTQWSRNEIVRTVLPFKEGAFHGGPLHTRNGSVQVEKMGPSWSDGSWRTAVVHLPSERLVPGLNSLKVFSGTRPARPFKFSKSIQEGAGSLRIRLRVGGKSVVVGGFKEVYSGHLTVMWIGESRIQGTPWWVEVTLVARSGLDHVRCWIHYGTSDSSAPVTWEMAGPIQLEVEGPAFHLYHQGSKSKLLSRAGSRTTVSLGTEGRWCEAQSQCLAGVLLFTQGADADTVLAEATLPVTAVSPDWKNTGAFGIWGVLPPATAPPNHETADWLAVQDYRGWKDGDPWEWPSHGTVPTPNTTGDQNDFSSVVMTREAHGWPERLYSISRSVYGEANRPTHIRQADGTPLAFSQRPDILLWQGRIDHRINSGASRLGKSRELAIWDPRKSGGNHQMAWWGHDRQHWSINYLAHYTLLTGDPWALRECQHKVELWLGEMRISSGSVVLDGMGAARAEGRTQQAACLLYLITGRSDLRERSLARVQVAKAQWEGGKVSGPVKTFLARLDPYPGNLDGKSAFWMPWQDALAIGGMDAVVLTFGDQDAAMLRDTVAVNLVRYGIWRKAAASTWPEDNLLWGSWTENGPLTCGKAVEWIPDGGDPRLAQLQHHRYDPYLTWCTQALKVVVVRNAGNESDRATAQECLDQLRAGGVTERLAEWLAIN